MRFFKKIYFFKAYQNWFSHNFKFWDIFSLTTYLHIKDLTGNKFIGFRKNSHTLELSLEQDLEVIYSNFSKQIRQQVRIAENEGIVCYFHQDIDGFVKFYNDFAATLGIYPTSKRRLTEMLPYLNLSYAVFDGEILAAHSYIQDESIGIVRHFHAATKRLDSRFDKNLIGRAGKLLTVKSIEHYKQSGYKIFDFGGFEPVTDNKILIGINNYKLLFGGKVVECANYYSPAAYILKLLAEKFSGLGKKATV